MAMLHMLKWDHQPSMRSRSWVLSIEEQRLEIADVLGDNPGLASLRDTRRPSPPLSRAEGKRRMC
ncbi:MAG: DUF29 family protein [Xanthobacteraceae bacterium]